MAPMHRTFHRNPEFWMRLAWRFCGKGILTRARIFAPDLIFAHHTCVNGWLALQLSRALSVPFVCQDHLQGEVLLCDRLPKRCSMFERIGDGASAMLVVSRKMAADLGRILPRAEVGILYNGAQTVAAPQGLVPAGRRPKTIFGVGMLTEAKGFEYVIRAWADVVRRFPDAKLRIAGDGPERARLSALRDSLGLAESVALLGYMSHEQVLLEMAQSRAFVLAAWNEAFGVVFTEAMGAGCPVVWGAECGVADVLRDGENGYAVAPRDPAAIANALHRLLESDDLASTVGAANRSLYGECFTWDAVAAQAMAIFRKALEEKGMF